MDEPGPSISARFGKYLVLCLKGVIATWRYDRGDKVISSDFPCHADGSSSQAASGLEITVRVDGPDQCRVEARDVFKANDAAGYRQRIERAEWRCRAVAADDVRQGEFADVLAIEPGRALRPRGVAKPGAEQQAQSQPF